METITRGNSFRFALEPPATTRPTTTDKLGLSLAGGGFRAALFHLGVLHRLAQLDLLRHVQVLSTVSGGSIVGAIYALRLKAWLEHDVDSPRLTSEDYVKIVAEVDDILRRGISQNLRGRLLINPLRTLQVMCTTISLGGAMAKLYEHHMLREAFERMPREPSWKPSGRRSALPLDHLKIVPPTAEAELLNGVSVYNANQVRTGGSVLTSLIMNATSLNSGGRFFFSGVELGDWYLGHFRLDEFEALKARRTLLKASAASLEEEWRSAIQEAKDARSLSPALREKARKLSLALWWKRLSAGESPSSPKGWEALFGNSQNVAFPGELPTCALGGLRQAKVAAWYLHEGYPTKITGGRSKPELWQRVCGVLGDLDRGIARWAEENVHGDEDSDPVGALLLEFLIELYMLRTAERMSPSFDDDWKALSISDAVGASACFPPVFPPFILLGLYDDAYVTRLGLTDGGVYDNMGIMALLDEGCTSIIASDTGGMFDERHAAPNGRILMSARLPSLFMRALAGFQRLELRERKRVCDDLSKIDHEFPVNPSCASGHHKLNDVATERQLNDLAYFHITTPPPELKPGDTALQPPLEVNAQMVATLRTDLDCFGEVEMAAIINQGYDTADRFVRGFMQLHRPEKYEENGQMIDAWNKAVPKAPAERVHGPRVDAVLEAGALQVGRALRLHAPWTMLVVALAGLAALYGALRGWRIGWLWSPVHAAIYTLPGFTRWIPEVVIPFFVRTLAAPIGLALLGIVPLALIFGLHTKRRAPNQRARFVRVRTFMKWATSLVWNTLWLAWALPLLIAMATSVVMVVSWVFFFWPWRALARIRPGDVKPNHWTGR